MVKAKNAIIIGSVVTSSILTLYLILRKKKSGTPIVGVILPDNKESTRWSTDKSLFIDAFEKAGITYDIQTFTDAANFTKIGDDMIAKGVKFLIFVSSVINDVDSINLVQKAKKAGIKTIAYDRINTEADYYVTFDNVEVGKLIGQGIVDALTTKNVKNPRICYLNGDTNDNNATLFKTGYSSIVQTYLSQTDGIVVGDEDILDYDNAIALTEFEKIFTTTGGNIDAVVAVNDGIAQSVINVLKKNKVNGKICVSGQDAIPDGVNSIINGDQSCTVYKSIKSEATLASKIVIDLASGKTVVPNKIVGNGTKALYATPTLITLKNIDQVGT